LRRCVAPSCSVGLSKPAGGSRPYADCDMSRFLAAIASLANGPRDAEPCSCRRPSAPFGWESPYRAATSSGIPCRAKARGRGFRFLDLGRRGTPKDAPRRFPSHQDHRASRRLRTRRLLVRDAFNWLDTTFRWSRPPQRRCSSIRCDPSTAFAEPRCPPDQGCGPSWACYPAGATRDVGTPPVHQERCLAPVSATNLLSRAPAETRRSQAWRSHATTRCEHPRAWG
jgi:hypothetical protein